MSSGVLGTWKADHGQARVGDRGGVEKMAELADPVREPWCRSRVVAVGVDRHRRARKRELAGASCRFVGVEATGSDDDELRFVLDHMLPGGCEGSLSV